MSDRHDTRTPGAALLVDLAENLTDLTIKRLEVPKGKATAFSEAVAAFIADHWGGQIIYIPMDISGKVMSRDAQIYSRFTGNNYAELAREYKLSLQYIYEIIKKERDRVSVKQHDLPLG